MKPIIGRKPHFRFQINTSSMLQVLVVIVLRPHIRRRNCSTLNGG
jgi:hypothetical protein